MATTMVGGDGGGGGGGPPTLSEVAKRVRLGVEIRNRSSMKVIYRNCFVGSDAVTFLVKSGLVQSRAAGVKLGRELAGKHHLRHVANASTFKDANLYYRFEQDEEHNHAMLREVSLGPYGVCPGVSAGAQQWGFAPHTAHNSLVLDLAFAGRLERDLQAPDLPTRRGALEALRKRVREQVAPGAPGWDSVKTTTINGTRSRVWTRQRPRGDFTNLKTEGAINVSPAQFLETFLDFSKRRKWDGSGATSDGTVVEPVFTPPNSSSSGSSSGGSSGSSSGGSNGSNRQRSGSPPSPPPPPPPPLPENFRGSSILGDGVGSDGGSSEVGSDGASSEASSGGGSAAGAAASAAGAGTGGAEEVFTTLRPPEAWGAMDLSACPENMSIANFQDEKLQETVQHLKEQVRAGSVDECMICSKAFRHDVAARDAYECPSCSRVCCSFCCSKRVFEVHLQDELRVCIHCYQESSRIKHPVGTLAYAKKLGQATMDFLSMAEIRRVLEEEAAQLAADEEAEAMQERTTDEMRHSIQPFPSPESSGSESTGGNSSPSPSPSPSPSLLLGGGSSPLAGSPLPGSPLAGSPLAGSPLAGSPLARSPLAAAAAAAGDDEGESQEELSEGRRSYSDATSEPTSEEADGAPLAPDAGDAGDAGAGAGAGAGAATANVGAAAAQPPAPPSTTEEGDAGVAGASRTKRSGGGVRFSPSVDGTGQGGGQLAKELAARKEKEKWATCKQCGARVERTMEGIERHDEICRGVNEGSGGGGGQGGGGRGEGLFGRGTGGGSDFDSGGSSSSSSSSSGSSSGGGLGGGKRGSLVGVTGSFRYTPNVHKLGGVPRLYPSATALAQAEVDKLKMAQARIVFRTRNGNELFRPRQVCALQDSFTDEETGLCCVYEISVRHRRVSSESDGHVTAEVLFMAHAARPVKEPAMEKKGAGGGGSGGGGASESAAILTVVSQVDARSRSRWLTKAFSAEDCQLGGLDVLKELMTGEAVETFEIRQEEATGKLAAANRAASKSSSAAAASASAAAARSAARSVSLADFELLAVLGRGGFGKVMQVRHKATGGVYAMKIFKKTELRKRRQVERTKTEREILSAVNHPFIVRLSFAFQTAAKLYMVMDFVQGGDFFTFMRKFGKLKEHWVRLYISEIAMALQHLHEELDVVYRDLKPENVLMDAEGHAKLTDFGLSRSFEMRPENFDGPKHAIGGAEDGTAGGTKKMTRSYCGTEQYMAPEMLLQRGHGRVVDWWCLGLLMHEMLTGRHPFQAASHYDTLRAMVTAEPVIDPRVGPTARALIRRLLIKDPRRRLGAQRGAWIELRPHPFFQHLDWDAVLRRAVPAPYVPPASGASGTDNFEDIFTREKPVDSVVEPEPRKGSSIFSVSWFGSKSPKSGKAAEAVNHDETGDFAGFAYNSEAAGPDGPLGGVPEAD